MTQTTTYKKVITIKIDYTTAERIKCVARQRIELDGLTIEAGTTFYLSRSSKNDGTYYITYFDVAIARWNCSCPSTYPCRHSKSVNALYVEKFHQHEEVSALLELKKRGQWHSCSMCGGKTLQTVCGRCQLADAA